MEKNDQKENEVKYKILFRQKSKKIRKKWNFELKEEPAKNRIEVRKRLGMRLRIFVSPLVGRSVGWSIGCASFFNRGF